MLSAHASRSTRAARGCSVEDAACPTPNRRALYAASEGLRVVVLEALAPGRQAGTSSRIENYPGFPEGISGAELAESTYEQAARLGAEILVGAELHHVTTESGRFRPDRADLRSDKQPLEGAVAGVELTNGAAFCTRTAVVATGVHYRRLEAEAEGVERLIGAGVFYGSSPSDAPLYRDGKVVVVGGANSAGQAALHLAEFARRVTMVVRGDSLAKAMSHYLVERIEADGANRRQSPRQRTLLHERPLSRVVVYGYCTGRDCDASTQNEAPG